MYHIYIYIYIHIYVPLLEAARGTKEDVDAAVDAANAAFKSHWSKVRMISLSQ